MSDSNAPEVIWRACPVCDDGRIMGVTCAGGSHREFWKPCKLCNGAAQVDEAELIILTLTGEILEYVDQIAVE